MSSYVARSKILEEMIIELRKKGFNIPPNVLGDLKSARTLMKVMDSSKKDLGETAPQIDQYLSSAEANLVTEAGKLLSAEKVEDYLKKLELASCETCVTIVEPKSTGTRPSPLRSIAASTSLRLVTYIYSRCIKSNFSSAFVSAKAAKPCGAANSSEPSLS